MKTNIADIDLMLQVLEEEILEEDENDPILLNSNDRTLLKSLLNQISTISSVECGISPTSDGEIVIETGQQGNMLFIYYLPNKKFHYIGRINNKRVSQIVDTLFDSNGIINDNMLLQILEEININS